MKRMVSLLLVLTLLAGTAAMAEYTILPLAEIDPAEKSEELKAAEALADPAMGQSAYVLRCVDQTGAPVPGAVLQVCSDELCRIVFTDESGVASLALDAFAWEVHLLRLPAGWRGDTEGMAWTPVEGGELICRVEKETEAE